MNNEAPVPNAAGVSYAELLNKGEGEVGIRQGYDVNKARKVAMEPTSKPTCPWCHQQTLNVRHNKSQGNGRIYCTNCSYDDSATASDAPANSPQGGRGVKILSKNGNGDANLNATGVKIVSGNRAGN